MTQNTIITRLESFTFYCLTNANSHSGLTGREIAVDYSTILTNLVPVFQKAFSLNDEILCFKYAEFGKDGAVSCKLSFHAIVLSTTFQQDVFRQVSLYKNKALPQVHGLSLCL